MFTLLNPKTKHLAGHAITKLHLNSSLTFQNNQSFQETFLLSFSTGPHTQIRNLHLTLLLFSLRKELGSSLESFSQVHRFTHQKKDKTDLISYSHFLKETRRLKNSLKLSTSHTFGSNHQERDFLSCKSDLFLFPLKNHKLGKDSSYSHLRIHDFFKEFLVMVFVVCKNQEIMNVRNTKRLYCISSIIEYT